MEEFLSEIDLTIDDVPSTMSDQATTVIDKRPVANIKTLKSKVFKHFTWISHSRQWQCLHCGKKYVHSPNGGSSTLSRHLKGKHPEEKVEESTKSTQRSVSDFMKEVPKDEVNRCITIEGFVDRLIKFVVNLNLPFTTVESEEFRDLISYCSLGNPKCLLPSARTFKESVDVKYEEHKQKIKTELMNTRGKISFSIDGWTSKNQHAFQGVVASWIDNNWELQTCLIDLTVLKGRHSGQNIAASFYETITEFEVVEKMLGITTDNASNMDTFFIEMDKISREKCLDFDSSKHRVRCLAHIINLVCKDVIKGLGSPEDVDIDSVDYDPLAVETNEATDTITKCRRGVAAIRSSPQRLETFEKFCSRSNVKPLALIRDVSTRWNSTYHMLERLKKMKESYMQTLNFLPELKKFLLTEEEWNKIEVIIEALSPFEKVTLVMSKGSSSTIADTAAVYQFLFEHLEKYFDPRNEPAQNSRKRSKGQETGYPKWLSDASRCGWLKLKKYYPSSDGLVYIISTVLDPRCKLQYFKNSGWDKTYIDNAKLKLTNLWNSSYKPNQPVHESQDAEEVEDTTDYLFQKMYEKTLQLGQKERPDDELRRYLSEPVVNPKFLKPKPSSTEDDESGSAKVNGSLGWWKIHEAEFPNLSKMARDFLGVSGTGVPVERIFSGGSDLCDVKRLRLHANSIKRAICLRNWLKREGNTADLISLYMDAIRNKILDVIEDDDCLIDTFITDVDKTAD